MEDYNTINGLNKDLFHDKLKKLVENGTNLNTTNKLNIDYITKKYSSMKQEVNEIFYDLILNSVLRKEEDGEYYFIFNDKKEYQLFQVFRAMKPINSQMWDKDTKLGVIKPIFNKYVKTHEQVKYSKDMHLDGLSFATKLLKSKISNQKYIYVTKEYIDIEDFYKIDYKKVKDSENFEEVLIMYSKVEILENIIKKVNNNVFIKYIREYEIRDYGDFIEKLKELINRHIEYNKELKLL
jgi:hypothetical protein